MLTYNHTIRDSPEVLAFGSIYCLVELVPVVDAVAVLPIQSHDAGRGGPVD